MADFCPQVARLLLAAGVDKINDLAEIIGEKPNAISNWNSRKRIPHKKVFPISQIVDCSAVWLESGEGPMRPEPMRPELVDQINEKGEDYLRTAQVDAAEEKLLKMFRSLDEYNQGLLLTMAETMSKI